VFVSTIGVLGNYSVEPFTEEKEPKPCNSYSISKCEAEMALHRVAEETGLEVVILRPPLVYGPGVKANFLRLMTAIYKRCPLPFGVAENKRHFISIRNFCSLTQLVLTHPAAAGETYLMADDEAVSTHDLIVRLAKLMGVKTRLIPVPLPVLRLGAMLLRKERMFYSICSSLQVDTAKAKTQLGWQPVQNLDDGLRETVHWFLEQQEKTS
jgi:UDP-glucose 4-epimerase